jgi:pimeloyl-ACP methyl ester carboxylesterase
VTEAEPLTLQTPNLRLEAKAWGPSDGLPIVALHGWLDNASTWDHLAPLLRGVRLIAIDSPGHGRSQHREQAPYHFIDYVAETLHALDWLVERWGPSFERPVLMGHSMGAGIMSLVSGARPERALGVVLVEGLGPLSEAPDQAVRRLARSVDAERRHAAKRKPVHPTLEAAAERVASVTAMQAASALTLVRRGMVQVDGGWTWSADSRLRIHSRQYLTEPMVHAYLEANAAPAMLIKAENGWPFDWPLMRERMRLMGTETHPVELVELTGHHHLHLDEPASVATALQPFLDDLRDHA